MQLQVVSGNGRGSGFRNRRRARSVRRSEDLLANRQSFLVETTLSGNTYLHMMVRARWFGYHVVLLFVGTGDVTINQARVCARVKKGGHIVPEEDQVRRYPRSMANFPAAFALADEAIVFDNSGSSHQKVAVKDAKAIVLYEPVPEWAKGLESAT